MILEHDIKLKTAQEARQDAEEMAKNVTVGSMIAAAAQTGMNSKSVSAQGTQSDEGPTEGPKTAEMSTQSSTMPQEDPEVALGRKNAMLTQAGQQTVSPEVMRAFDMVWADPFLARMGQPPGDFTFMTKLLEDSGFRNDKQEKLMQLFLAKDTQ